MVFRSHRFVFNEEVSDCASRSKQRVKKIGERTMNLQSRIPCHLTPGLKSCTFYVDASSRGNLTCSRIYSARPARMNHLRRRESPNLDNSCVDQQQAKTSTVDQQKIANLKAQAQAQRPRPPRGAPRRARESAAPKR